MTKIKDLVRANRWYIAAYVVYFIVFWFVGNGAVELSVFTAYAGAVLLHLFFACAVWFIKKIISKS